MSTIKLSTGEWPFDEVLPYDWADFSMMFGQEPEKPFDEKEIVGGGTEQVTPPDDDPRWKEYNEAVNRWSHKINQFELVRAFARVEVPDDWELPAGVSKVLGIQTATDPYERQYQFVRYEIVRTKADTDEVARRAKGIITEEERAAGAGPFPGDAGVPEE